MTDTSDMDKTNTMKRPAGQEKQPQQPKKPKTTVSVLGLFVKKHQPHCEDGGTTSSATRKRADNRPLEDAETARARQHPAYIEVKGIDGQFISNGLFADLLMKRPSKSMASTKPRPSLRKLMPSKKNSYRESMAWTSMENLSTYQVFRRKLNSAQ